MTQVKRQKILIIKIQITITHQVIFTLNYINDEPNQTSTLQYIYYKTYAAVKLFKPQETKRNIKDSMDILFSWQSESWSDFCHLHISSEGKEFIIF